MQMQIEKIKKKDRDWRNKR